jgi:hypothetical protein
MTTKRMSFLSPLFSGNPSPSPGNNNPLFGKWLIIGFGLLAMWLLLGGTAFAAGLPGGDEAVGKLKAASSLLSIVDTALFKWGARIFAGLCIMSAGWALKEQRFGVAIVCVIGAILVGTAPSWVKNIFEISGGDSVFSSNETVSPNSKGASRYA